MTDEQKRQLLNELRIMHSADIFGDQTHELIGNALSIIDDQAEEITKWKLETEAMGLLLEKQEAQLKEAVEALEVYTTPLPYQTSNIEIRKNWANEALAKIRGGV